MTRLKLLRMQRGLTQRQLASILGLSPSFLSRLEGAWFTRCPNHSEVSRKLRAFFGPGESFESLMEEATPNTAPVKQTSRLTRLPELTGKTGV